LETLMSLNLVGTQIKDEQVESLRAQMPNTKIRN
jgi:hypothetical protein